MNFTEELNKLQTEHIFETSCLFPTYKKLNEKARKKMVEMVSRKQANDIIHLIEKQNCRQCGHTQDHHEPFYNRKGWHCKKDNCCNWRNCEKPKKKRQKFNYPF